MSGSEGGKRADQDIYELNPLTCPKYQGRMCILSFIAAPELIKKILKHLDLWDVKVRAPPKAKTSSKCTEQWIDYSDYQLPPSDDYLYVDEKFQEIFSA